MKKVLFRFTFVYLLLFILPFPLEDIPGVAAVGRVYHGAWHALVTRVGARVFGLEVVIALHNGSGDTTYKYLRALCCLAAAGAAAILWTLIDRRRLNYTRLHLALTIYLRFFLASAMVFYGALKLFPAQFPEPSLERLVEPFGDASPMGLLWTFMGASRSYNLFAGAGEVLGGLLLTSRRTTLLGALISAGILGNVVALNYSYDVPVKLYSSTLLGIALYLVALDWRRLANLFVLNRPTQPVVLRPPLGRKWLRYGIVLARTSLVAAYVCLCLSRAYHAARSETGPATRPPLYGIWNVETFTVDGKDRPPLLTDEGRWRRVIFDSRHLIAIHMMNDSRRHYGLEIDPSRHVFTLSTRTGRPRKTVLTYEQPETGVLSVEGVWDGRRVRARLRRVDRAGIPLLNRGFHWISEKPFNR
ncbi:MAG TPA: hypothetical protein VJ739_00125 [Gemmataceae bacterium]|nr:hypothetical protein [Gemmataceae bacterium]